MTKTIWASPVLQSFFSISILFSSTALATETSLEFEYDPYYSNAGHYVGLTKQSIPEITSSDEAAIYQKLLDSTLQWPRFMLLEASVNPLPVLGVYIKKYHRDFYDSTETRGNNNLVQAFTAGFEEPYALSLFFGSVVRFVKPGEAVKLSNRGYSGYLLSVGNRHIVNNDLIDDNWYQLEWKIKGDQDFKNKTLSWSFRVGTKVHNNIADVGFILEHNKYFGSPVSQADNFRLILRPSFKF